MIPPSAVLTSSFKQGLLSGEFDFSSDTAQVFKLALYGPSAALSVATTAYTASNESSGAGYTAGGATVTIAANPTITGTSAYVDFADVSWAGATLTARYALLYLANGTTNPSVMVLDLGSEVGVSAGTLTISFPDPAFGTPPLMLG